MSRLYRMSGPDEARADVVFVHGLGGDAVDTWLAKPNESSWVSWLGEDFPEVAVWSLGYPASPTRWLRILGWCCSNQRDAGYGMALPHRGRQVLDLLAQEGLGSRPLMFVGHSLGGLVIKQVLRTAKDAPDQVRRRMYDSTRGVLFLATPHAGAPLATLIDRFRSAFGSTATVADLGAHDPHLQELYDWYRHNSANIATRAYLETRPVGGTLPIVDATSAHAGVGGVDPVPLDEDHFSIAKPASRDAQVYRAAVELLRDYVVRNSDETPPRSVQTDATKVDSKRHVDVPNDRRCRARPACVAVLIGMLAFLAWAFTSRPWLVPQNLERARETSAPGDAASLLVKGRVTLANGISAPFSSTWTESDASPRLIGLAATLESQPGEDLNLQYNVCTSTGPFHASNGAYAGLQGRGPGHACGIRFWLEGAHAKRYSVGYYTEYSDGSTERRYDGDWSPCDCNRFLTKLVVSVTRRN